MTPGRNVFDEDPAAVSSNGAGAGRSAVLPEMPNGRGWAEHGRSQGRAPVNTGGVQPTSAMRRVAWARFPGGATRTPEGTADASEDAVDPGMLLLPEEVYPDSAARSRVSRWLQRLLQSESERRESAVDRRLAKISARVIPTERVVVACSPKGGSGKTTLALGLAQTLARLCWPTLVVDLDLTGGTAGLHAQAQGRHAGGTLVDAIEAVDAGAVQGPADLAGHLMPVGGGAALLAGPPSRAQRQSIGVEQVERLLETLTRYWPVVIVDTSPGTGDRDRVQQWALEHATDVVAVAVPLRVDAVQARSALAELCAMLPDTPLTVALNKVPSRPDQPTRRVMSVPLAPARSAHRVEVPHDERLGRQLDRAALRLDKLARATRLAFKELAAALADGWC